MADAPSSYAPDLTPEEIFTEKAWLQGALLASITYGWVVVLAFQCVYLLLQSTARPHAKQVTYGLIAYVVIQFACCTVFQACNSTFTQMAFIEDRNYPGGPGAYENDFWNIPINAAGNTLFTIMNWLADALLIWRYYVIFRGSSRIPVWVYMFIPGLAFTGSLVVGCFYIRQEFISNVFQAVDSINWSDKFLGLSLSLNIALTLAIAIRLTAFRFQIRKSMGPAYGTQYTSVASMIVESALLYSVASLLFLVPFALGHQLSIIFIQALSSIQITSSLLIIYRVAQGKAWSANTSNEVFSSSRSQNTAPNSMQMSAIRFGNHTGSTTLQGDRSIISKHSGEDVFRTAPREKEFV